ncbi:MAG TPA: hypothetical protein VG711_04070, partial [Phycisphaerales bacterium]|nr:hypothetical protein [Phycisphaerales bacterium]
LRTKELVQSLRGVDLGQSTVEVMVDRGRASMAGGATGQKTVPVATSTVSSKAGAGPRGGRSRRQRAEENQEADSSAPAAK